VKHYAIAAFREGSETAAPRRVMLYRFDAKRDRDRFASESDYRLGVPRDVARILFPILRNPSVMANPAYWCDLVMTIPGRENRLKTKAQYLTDSSGWPLTAPFEMIPARVPGSVQVMNHFRRSIANGRLL